MPPIILITGATGFIGSHVVLQALEAGFSVRITARPPKVDPLRKLYEGKDVSVLPIEDAVSADYGEALQGVEGVIHLAAPLAMKASDDAVKQAHIQGKLRLLEQASKAGIKKVVASSQLGTVVNFAEMDKLFDESHCYTTDDWNPIDEDTPAPTDMPAPFYAYTLGSTVGERKVWEFADQHPDMDITTINVSTVYGPYAPEFFTVNSTDISFTTNSAFRDALLDSQGQKLPPVQQFPLPKNIDVRDAAKAFVRAIQTNKPYNGHKRIFLTSPGFLWKDAVGHLKQSHPEIAERLPDASEATDHGMADFDTTLAKETLCMTEFIDWRKTVDDTVDSLLELERGSTA